MENPKYYGEFYSAEPREGLLVGCRSVLEICRKGRSLDDIKDNHPDLYVIMMNPGGSHPKGTDPDSWFEEKLYKSPRFVEAEPDKTQLQIVEVLERLKLDHARILNLTNYCQPQSRRLFEHGDEFLRKQSVFGPGRVSIEIPKGAKVLKAWGVRPRLKVLKDLVRIEGVGVLKKGTRDCYRHPLPRNSREQEFWVELASLSLNCNNSIFWS